MTGRDDDKEIHSYGKLCAWQARASGYCGSWWSEGRRAKEKGQRGSQALALKRTGQFSFQISWQHSSRKWQGQRKLGLVEAKSLLLRELLDWLGLFTEGSEGRGGAFLFYPMPRASPDSMTFWERYCGKQCKKLPIFSSSFLPPRSTRSWFYEARIPALRYNQLAEHGKISWELISDWCDFLCAHSWRNQNNF